MLTIDGGYMKRNLFLGRQSLLRFFYQFVLAAQDRVVPASEPTSSAMLLTGLAAAAFAVRSGVTAHKQDPDRPFFYIKEHDMKAQTLKLNRFSFPAQSRALVCRAALSLGVLAASAGIAHADGPGRGNTAHFEKNYLVFIINHHYSALRMTELAAGTDPMRDPQIAAPQEGTSPTPGFGATPAKASDDEIRSMARMGNREQREEIARAQRMLREWYGIQYQPQLTPDGRRMIAMLEATPTGSQFNQVFLRSFSNHHLGALAPSLHCTVKSDLNHDGLQRYCENIVIVQKNGINDMREMLCKKYADCGFIPMTGDKRKDHEF